MSEINTNSTLTEVAAIVSEALKKAGIAATLSGGGAVAIYSDNQYQSKDLDFVTAAIIAELEPALTPLGFVRTAVPRLSQFEHPLIEWYVEFPPSPLAFGNLYVDHKDCAVIEMAVGELRIITPTQSVMDRLAAAFHWNDPQSQDQAILVAASQQIDWESLQLWFKNEGESDAKYQQFRQAVMAKGKK